MRVSVAVLAITALAVTGPGLAQTPPAEDVVSTAPAEGGRAPLSTRQQIDQFLASSPALDRDLDSAARDAEGERRIRGEVSVGVGTGGYRSGAASAVVPLGEAGVLALRYSRTENGYGHVGPGQPEYGYGYDSLLEAPASWANCGAGLRERGGYGQPELTGRAPGPAAERCATR